jgi:hypothetical protein
MACVALLSSFTPSRPTGRLVAGPAMGSARAAHTATALRDGRVLLAGGFTQDERRLAGAELFDPARGRVLPTGPMVAPRQSHEATLLPDGSVLVTGGYDGRGNCLASAEIYDPALGTFRPAGSLMTARAGHRAVLLDDGRVLVVGGVGAGWTFLASAELYDPRSQRSVPTGPMRVPRESHAAVRLNDGRVLVVGGHRGRHERIELFASAELYDARTRRFTPAGSMHVRRHKHDAVVLRDGSVLINGGADERDDRGVYDDAELYDVATGQFTRVGPMRFGRYKHCGTSILLPDGRVLLAGGAPQAETYDPESRRFSAVEGAVRMLGQFSACARLPGGRVLISGGYGAGHGPRASTWLYQP